jgi:hypothetical protein
VILAIDPGVDSGWAIFFQGMLVACGLGGAPKPLPERFDLLIVEHPVVYPGGRTKDPNAIVKLAINAGMWMGRYESRASNTQFIFPRDWKGTIDGDLCNRRTWAKLDDGERQVLDDAVRTQKIPAKKRHNVLDAIGIGLHASGRK